MVIKPLTDLEPQGVVHTLSAGNRPVVLDSEAPLADPAAGPAVNVLLKEAA